MEELEGGWMRIQQEGRLKCFSHQELALFHIHVDQAGWRRWGQRRSTMEVASVSNDGLRPLSFELASSDVWRWCRKSFPWCASSHIAEIR